MIIIRKLNFKPVTIITQTGHIKYVEIGAPTLGNPMRPHPGPLPVSELGNIKSSRPNIPEIGKNVLRRKWTPVRYEI